MANCKEMLIYLCSGLPLNPMPVNTGRSPNIAHAPTRKISLTQNETKVKFKITKI